jgi:hypothetical protein
MKLPIVFCAAVISLVGASAARAGQVAYRKQTTQQALAQAALVVTVKLEAPAMRGVKIPVALPKGYAPENNFNTKLTKPCDAYEFGAWVVTVEKVVHPAAHAPVKAGDRLVIFPANTGALLELTRDGCEHGGSKSPIFADMADGVEPKDGETLTVLLRWEETVGWVEAMGGSWMKDPPAPPEKQPAVSFSWTRGDDALCVEDADCVVAVAPKLDADGELVCGMCPPCALAADTPMSKATSQRVDALCAKKRASEGVVATCEACAPTKKKAQCKNMRCVKKP